MQPFAKRSQSDRLFVVSSYPNSTYDLFIEPRIPDGARAVQIDPWRSNLWRDGDLPPDSVVVVCRYVTSALLRFLWRQQSRISRLIYFLDDDLGAMISSTAVPFRSKLRPAETLCLRWIFRAFTSRLDSALWVASSALARKYQDFGAKMVRPVVDLSGTPQRSLDNQHICYLAKMHRPEHEFLLDVVPMVLEAHPQSHFTVIASGLTANAWRCHKQVTVWPEMGLDAFRSATATLDAGVSLAPIVPSRLNACRSGAKRTEIARIGSAGVFADAAAYSRKLPTGELLLPMKRDVWVDGLTSLLDDNKRCVELGAVTRQVVMQDFAQREMLRLT